MLDRTNARLGVGAAVVTVRQPDGGPVSWDVQVVGHLCIDLVPQLERSADTAPGKLVHVGPLAVRLGGCVGNTGLDLAALGIRSLLVSSVGNDPLSGIVKALVEDQRTADHQVFVEPDATTSYSIVIEPPDADRTFWHHEGSNALFDGSSVDMHAAPLLHLGYLPLLPRLTEANGFRLREMLCSARAASVATSIDMCVVDPLLPPVDWELLLTDILPMCDVISPSADDMRSAFSSPELSASEAAEWLVSTGVAVAMVTDGPRGLVARTAKAERFVDVAVLRSLPPSWHDQNIELRPVAGPVVQTTAAGDAATAGLLAAIYRKLEFDDALSLVLGAAAHRVAGKGALTALAPRLHDTT